MSRAGRTRCDYCPGITMLVFVFITLWFPGAQAYRPFTPPPQTGNKPIVSNGIVYYLNHIPAHCREPLVITYPSGGIVQGKRALLERDNPHVIYGNIEIPPDACLWIEPGCVLRFGPGYGIIVNGTLIARGSEEDGGRITMTKDRGEDTGAPTGNWSYNARLSGGNTTQDGRLDLLYQGKWRAICTNYQNFTDIDVNVTCRHLGFLKGNFTYHSFSRNLTDYMLWEKPGCTGSETTLFECPGVSRIRAGAHICDGQQVVGFECEGLRPGLAVDHWRGIQFFNSSSHDVQKGSNIFQEESWSWLEYLDISYPGLDTYHGRTSEPDIYYPLAAVSASPLVPLINNVTIKYGAYDAFNLTEITGPIHIANSSVHKCRGNGIFIQTAVGMTLINMTQVTENWGDGIKFYISNLTIHDFQHNFSYASGFCFQPDLDRQMFPVFQHLDAVAPNGYRRLSGRECMRRFSTTLDRNVNLHFLIMESDPEASGKLIVYDGGGSQQKIGEYKVANGSFPQSVRTMTNVMTIHFEYRLPPRGCKTFQPCIRFLLRLTTTYGTEEEFRLIYSTINDNVGYGVNVQDMRSKVFFNTSEVSRNQFGAGIRVYKGAGEIVINNTILEGNTAAGINITYSGGYQLINNTQLIRNKGYGVITEYLQFNQTRVEFMQKVEIVRAMFLFNELIGLRMGNYCRGGAILVNESHFSYNQDEAIEYLSCNISTGMSGPTNFSIAFTEFKGNRRHAVLMKPLLNTVGIITNCSFSNHSLGVIRIDNGYDLLISKWYREFPVDYNIFENTFQENRGRYAVYLRLTDGSPKHRMYFKFNTLKNNYIQESFMYTNPRNRANAVAVISSGNVEFKRNILANREHSVREVATHLLDPSVTINAEENYWDIEIYRPSDFEVVHMSIFDQDDRYNLAKIDYFPALKIDRVYEDQLTHEVPEYRWDFAREGNIIGGLLDDNGFTGSQGQTYYVDRDIYVFPGQTVTLQKRVTLEFAPSVGMVVHGRLKADGENAEGAINFKMWTDPDLLPLKNRTASVRLSNGSDLYEGRLEVLIDDEWGTVCSKGWTDREASLVCQQLGLIYYPDQGASSLRVVAPKEMRVLMAWVACDEADEDLTECRAIHAPDINCDHNQDVYLRCQEPTWAGVTLAATARNSQYDDTQIRAVNFERAGLLDAETMSFTPALRIDYNFYQITAVSITDSLSDGICINYIHPFAEVRLESIQIHNNHGHGVVTRYPRLHISHSNVTRSGKAGFLYDPFFSEYEALSVRTMIHETRRSFINDSGALSIGNGDMTFLLCPPGTDDHEDRVYTKEVSTASNTYRIVVQILDFFPVREIEEVTIFDAPKTSIGPSTKRWHVPQDLVDFPIMSTTRTITIQLRVRGIRSGRLAFAVLSQQASTDALVLNTTIYNSTFLHNGQGIQTKHYNSPTNKRLEVFHRFRLESITFLQVHVHHSKKEAIHMPSVTKFTDDYIPTYEDMTVPERVATIRYNISLCKFLGNKAGILAEHNHVDFANNVWHWYIGDLTTFENTEHGGVEIEVPRVNDFNERMKHKVTVKECIFKNNWDFAFTIKGYYADVQIEDNRFDNNLCRLGLVSVLGMEKNMSLVNNKMSNNVGRHMLDINILSHSEYSAPVQGIMENNTIQNNRYEGLDPPGYANTPKTFAVAFKGVQNMTANRNLFSNPDLDYELIAGVTALSLGNPVNVRENYWGRTDYSGIMERIFDFDDWNNYAIADFFPYLTSADINSDLSSGDPVKPPLDTDRLGGRVLEDEILAYKATPYIVERDLTIMPEATLTISAGTELQFLPNVGILVLGRLVAKGREYNRIKLRPVQSTTGPGIPQRKKRAATATVRLMGDGSLFQDAGFLELFNTSTKTWNMMCDSQFNEKSAEVVCRQLGKEIINVRVRFTHLYDFYIYKEPQYFLKEFWFESYFCRGDETDLRQCITRYNYNMQQCIQAANYTFITCGERNLEAGQKYWGNVRFASQSYQEQPLEDDIGRQESVLEYVDIEGAGMLHGEKIGAVQTTYVSPRFQHLNITKCAENGFDVIAPRSILDMTHLNVSNNLGFGFNFLVLNGESSERDSSFLLLGPSTIPYYVFGLVEMCRMEKEIVLDTRMILYYKYGPTVRNCVKIIRGSNPHSRIGLRFLQMNMFHEDFSLNVVEIFDGWEINHSSMMAELMANTSSDSLGHLYKSSGDTLTIHLHASVSHGTYGFIAEVVHIPLTGLTYPDSNYKHTLSKSISTRNQDGALQYKNVGEVNPSFFVDHCWMEDNGVAILNLTSPPTIDISLQGTLLFRFASNFVSRNKGGMYLSLHTKTIATALRGNITNNVFSFGTNGEALNITGHYYQRLYIFQNYIFNNTAGDWRDVVHIQDVVVNYTYNYLDNNTGNYILATYNSNNQKAQQEFTRSGFLRNNATALLESTIKIGRGRPFFENNYIVNEDNDFEMETYPKVDTTDRSISAKDNWWGSELRSYINGKIWDELDDKQMVAVDFWQPKLDNRTVVDEGKCPPGWKVDNERCYRFMGGALPYYQARDFCREIGAFLGEARGREGFYNYLLRLMRNTNNPEERVWVMSEVGSSRCSALEYSYIVYEEDCWNLLYPFICEKDPYLSPPGWLESSVRAMTIGIGAGIGGVLILVAVILGVLWCVKSKRRERERFERTASLRSSVRSSMRMSKSTLTMLSEGHSRRRINEIDINSEASSGATKASRVTDGLNGSIASLNQVQRNGRYPAADRSLGDRRGAERNRWREREEEREYAMERERDIRRGRRRREDEEEEDSREDRRRREESESEIDKKELEDSEEDDSFDSDEDEEEGEEEEEAQAAARARSENRLYHNNGVPLPGLGPGARRLARSRDDVYDNQFVETSPTKSKSLSSFSQPATPDESPAGHIFLPRHSDLPSPPPTPRSQRASPPMGRQNPAPQVAAKPSVRPKPSATPTYLHPAVGQLRQSPVPSEGSVLSASGRPSPLPRKNFGGSQGSIPREMPSPYGASRNPDYENQAAPLPPKHSMGSRERLPRSHDTSFNEPYDYTPTTPRMSPSHRLPNLPRYSPPLPMERPPAYDESDHYPAYSRYEPDYRSHGPADSYIPSQEPPEQDVQYLPRSQPHRPQFHGSRDRLGGSHDRLDGSRENLSGSRNRLNQPYSPAAYTPNVLYLGRNNGDGTPQRPEHLETEI
ncbi:protein bark beetle-like [Babylonia areolata]|uniref:protein bark beetle-like n=1 Tax=Babylonia areolata TaxID=304850 RepID=UPI003FCF5D4A